MTICPADIRWMRLAIELGKRGLGQTWPNPSVGCVLVKNGRLIGQGWTQPGGRPHAEVVALAQAGADANDATAYVSLEPCAHYGKTGPCAIALVDAGVAKIFSAMQDPDPRVAGKGHAILDGAGINVHEGLLAQEAKESHQGFLSRVTKNRPWVTLKLAGTLDARIATATGHSQWITSPHAREMVHLLRSQHDAVLVGKGTVVADDPSLDVRLAGLANRVPVRIVFDSKLECDPANKLGRLANIHPVWMCHSDKARPENIDAWHSTGAKTIPTMAPQVDPIQALTALADLGLTKIFCEGGGQLAASLIKAQVVDEIIIFSAGKILGSAGAPNFGALGGNTLSDFPDFVLMSERRVGPDLMSVWRPI